MIQLPIEKTNILGDNLAYVALTDIMGDDRTPARTARTSFRNSAKERSEEQDKKLTKYLITHRHNTPLEFCQLRFYMKMPIFVARQLVRHRMQSINEMSLRYVESDGEFYVPQKERMNKKHVSNKQGSSTEIIEDHGYATELMNKINTEAYNAYRKLLDIGLAPELARGVLPTSVYTEWYCQYDMHNFLHMVKLRIDPHAQWEVQQFANASLELAQQVFPEIISTWKEVNGVA